MEQPIDPLSETPSSFGQEGSPEPSVDQSAYSQPEQLPFNQPLATPLPFNQPASPAQLRALRRTRAASPAPAPTPAQAQAPDQPQQAPLAAQPPQPVDTQSSLDARRRVAAATGVVAQVRPEDPDMSRLLNAKAAMESPEAAAIFNDPQYTAGWGGYAGAASIGQQGYQKARGKRIASASVQEQAFIQKEIDRRAAKPSIGVLPDVPIDIRTGQPLGPAFSIDDAAMIGEDEYVDMLASEIGKIPNEAGREQYQDYLDKFIPHIYDVNPALAAELRAGLPGQSDEDNRREYRDRIKTVKQVRDQPKESRDLSLLRKGLPKEVKREQEALAHFGPEMGYLHRTSREARLQELEKLSRQRDQRGESIALDMLDISDPIDEAIQKAYPIQPGQSRAQWRMGLPEGVKEATRAEVGRVREINKFITEGGSLPDDVEGEERERLIESRNKYLASVGKPPEDAPDRGIGSTIYAGTSRAMLDELAGASELATTLKPSLRGSTADIASLLRASKEDPIVARGRAEYASIFDGDASFGDRVKSFLGSGAENATSLMLSVLGSKGGGAAARLFRPAANINFGLRLAGAGAANFPREFEGQYSEAFRDNFLQGMSGEAADKAAKWEAGGYSILSSVAEAVPALTLPSAASAGKFFKTTAKEFAEEFAVEGGQSLVSQLARRISTDLLGIEKPDYDMMQTLEEAVMGGIFGGGIGAVGSAAASVQSGAHKSQASNIITSDLLQAIAQGRGIDAGAAARVSAEGQLGATAYEGDIQKLTEAWTPRVSELTENLTARDKHKLIRAQAEVGAAPEGSPDWFAKGVKKEIERGGSRVGPDQLDVSEAVEPEQTSAEKRVKVATTDQQKRLVEQLNSNKKKPKGVNFRVSESPTYDDAIIQRVGRSLGFDVVLYDAVDKDGNASPAPMFGVQLPDAEFKRIVGIKSGQNAFRGTATVFHEVIGHAMRASGDKGRQEFDNLHASLSEVIGDKSASKILNSARLSYVSKMVRSNNERLNIPDDKRADLVSRLKSSDREVRSAAAVEAEGYLPQDYRDEKLIEEAVGDTAIELTRLILGSSEMASIPADSVGDKIARFFRKLILTVKPGKKDEGDHRRKVAQERIVAASQMRKMVSSLSGNEAIPQIRKLLQHAEAKRTSEAAQKAKEQQAADAVAEITPDAQAQPTQTDQDQGEATTEAAPEAAAETVPEGAAPVSEVSEAAVAQDPVAELQAELDEVRNTVGDLTEQGADDAQIDALLDREVQLQEQIDEAMLQEPEPPADEADTTPDTTTSEKPSEPVSEAPAKEVAEAAETPETQEAEATGREGASEPKKKKPVAEKAPDTDLNYSLETATTSEAGRLKALSVPEGEGGSMPPATWSSLDEMGYDPENAQDTQRKNTEATYAKWADLVPPGSSVLDFSAGLGYGTVAFRDKGHDISAYEPYTDEAKRAVSPEFTQSTELESNAYDYVVNNAVLNVVPLSTRVEILQEINRVLKPGGTAFISVRSWGEVKKNLKAGKLVGPRETLTSTGTFQKGFKQDELYSFIQTVLPDVKVDRLGVGDVKLQFTKPAEAAPLDVNFSLEFDDMVIDAERRVSEARADYTKKDAANWLVEKSIPLPRAFVQASLGKYPERLNEVVDFMLAMREKVVGGNIKPRDIAKAYIITVASQGGRETWPSMIESKTGFKVPDLYIEASGKARPEDVAAAWLASENGQKALDNIDSDKFDPDDWAEMFDIRQTWGDDRLNTNNVAGVAVNVRPLSEKKKGDQIITIPSHVKKTASTEKVKIERYFWTDADGMQYDARDDRRDESGKLLVKPRAGKMVSVDPDKRSKTTISVELPADHTKQFMTESKEVEVYKWNEGATRYKVKDSDVGKSREVAVGKRNVGKAQRHLGHAAELAKAVNDAKGDVTAIEKALGDLVGIGKAKLPFIKHLFGFGDAPTIDAVEINYWLTGTGDTRRLAQGGMQNLSWLIQEVKDNSRLGNAVADELNKRVFDLLENSDLLPDNVPAEYAGHILHHWLWDDAKGTQTGHAGMMDAMLNASLQETDAGLQSDKRIPAELDNKLSNDIIAKFKKDDPDFKKTKRIPADQREEADRLSLTITDYRIAGTAVEGLTPSKVYGVKQYLLGASRVDAPVGVNEADMIEGIEAIQGKSYRPDRDIRQPSPSFSYQEVDQQTTESYTKHFGKTLTEKGYRREKDHVAGKRTAIHKRVTGLRAPSGYEGAPANGADFPEATIERSRQVHRRIQKAGRAVSKAIRSTDPNVVGESLVAWIRNPQSAPASVRPFINDVTKDLSIVKMKDLDSKTLELTDMSSEADMVYYDNESSSVYKTYDLDGGLVEHGLGATEINAWNPMTGDRNPYFAYDRNVPLLDYIQRYDIANQLGMLVYTEVVGITDTNKLLIKQPYIEGLQDLTEQSEADAAIEQMGITRFASPRMDQSGWVRHDGKVYMIFDLHVQNVQKTPDGSYFLVDPALRELTVKEQVVLGIPEESVATGTSLEQFLQGPDGVETGTVIDGVFNLPDTDAANLSLQEAETGDFDTIDTGDLVGEMSTIFPYDRMKTGWAVYNVGGIKVKMLVHGGPDHPHTEDRQGLAGIATRGKGSATSLLNKILKIKPKYGIIILGRHEQLIGNTDFAKLYMRVAKARVKKGLLDESDFLAEFNKKRVELLSKRAKKQGKWVDVIGKTSPARPHWEAEWTNLDQIDKALNVSSFDQRKEIFDARPRVKDKKFAGVRGFKDSVGSQGHVDRGFPDLSDIFESLIENDWDHLPAGTAVSAVEFGDDVKLGTAKELGFKDHPGYPYNISAIRSGRLSHTFHATDLEAQDWEGQTAAERQLKLKNYIHQASNPPVRVGESLNPANPVPAIVSIVNASLQEANADSSAVARELINQPHNPLDNLGMYSPLGAFVDTLTQKKLTREQFLGMAKKSGVKEEELEWSGFNFWAKGRSKFTLAELKGYVKTNRVKMIERTLGDRDTASYRQETDHYMAADAVKWSEDGLSDIISDTTDYMDGLGDDGRTWFNVQGTLAIKLAAARSQTSPQAMAKAVASIPDPKYFQIPDRVRKEIRDELLDNESFREEVTGYIAALAKLANTPRPVVEHTGQYKDYTLGGAQNYQEILFYSPEFAGTYSAPHFNEDSDYGENLLMHARLTDREVGGKQILFIEEVQSDLHQAGRERGYKTEGGVQDAFDKLGKARNRVQGIRDEMLDRGLAPDKLGKIHRDDHHKFMIEAMVEIVRLENDPAVPGKTYQKWVQEMKGLAIEMREALPTIPDARDALDAEQQKISRAPFEKTWSNFLLKRIVRKAVEEGYSGIGWTTGDMQADRYDQSLKESVDRIVVKREEDGVMVYTVSAYKEGRKVTDREVEEDSGLRGLIGKSMADSAIASFEKDASAKPEFTGDDISIGGHGFRTFYDKMFRGEAKKLGKKWRVKPEVQDLTYGSGSGVNTDPIHTMMFNSDLEQSVADQGLPQFSLQYSDVGSSSSDLWWMGVDGLQFAAAEAKASPSFTPRFDGATRPQDHSDIAKAWSGIVRGKVDHGEKAISLTGPLDSNRWHYGEIEQATRAAARQLRLMFPDYAVHTFGEAQAPLASPNFALGESIPGGGFAIQQDVWYHKARRKFQDKFEAIQRLQRAIEDAGGSLDEQSDVYLYESLFHGKLGRDIDVLQRNYVAPMMRALSESGLEMSRVDQIAMARFARERNEYVREINPDFQADYFDEEGNLIESGGSGMPDPDADEILAEARKNGDWDKAQPVLNALDKMNDMKLRALVRSGMLSKESAAAMKKRYPNYVPLVGHSGDTLQPELSFLSSGPADPEMAQAVMGVSSTRYSVSEEATKRTTGRVTLAESPIVATVALTTNALVMSRRNEVAQSLLKLVYENPDPDMWEIDKHRTSYYLDRQSGEVRKRTAKQTAQYSERVIDVRVDGELVSIYAKDRRIAEAMRNLKASEMPSYLRVMGMANRYYSQLRTQYNPAFMPVNFFRDWLTAGIHTGGEIDSKFAASVMGKSWIVMRAIYNYERQGRSERLGKDAKDPKGSQYWRDMMERFEEAGGRVSFLGLQDFESRRKELDHLLDDMRGEGGKLRSALKPMRAMMGWATDVNAMAENAARLAAFETAINRGWTDARAASLARNLTVNFNRRGTSTNAIGSLFAFFNASVQGNTRMLQAMVKSKGVRRIAMSIVGFSAMLSLFNGVFGGEDENGVNRWAAIPAGLKARNLIILLPGGDMIRFPLPWGYNVFHALGTNVMDTVMGIQAPSSAAFSTVMSVADSFNPIGQSATFVQQFTPTVLEPFVQWTENTAWHGGPVYKEPFPGQDTPNAYQHFNSVRDASKWGAQFMNEATGGNQFKSGWMDVNPEMLDHASNALFGAAGTFAADVVDLARTVGDDPRKVGVRDVPFLNKFYATPSEYASESDFFGISQEIKSTLKLHKSYVQAGMTEEAADLLKRRGDLMGGEEIMDEAYDLQKELRDRADLLREMGESRDERMASLQDYLRMYNEKKDEATKELYRGKSGKSILRPMADIALTLGIDKEWGDRFVEKGWSPNVLIERIEEADTTMSPRDVESLIQDIGEERTRVMKRAAKEVRDIANLPKWPTKRD